MHLPASVCATTPAGSPSTASRRRSVSTLTVTAFWPGSRRPAVPARGAGRRSTRSLTVGPGTPRAREPRSTHLGGRATVARRVEDDRHLHRPTGMETAEDPGRVSVASWQPDRGDWVVAVSRRRLPTNARRRSNSTSAQPARRRRTVRFRRVGGTGILDISCDDLSSFSRSTVAALALHTVGARLRSLEYARRVSPARSYVAASDRNAVWL